MSTQIQSPSKFAILTNLDTNSHWLSNAMANKISGLFQSLETNSKTWQDNDSDPSGELKGFLPN